jgi:hypothetical protein
MDPCLRRGDYGVVGAVGGNKKAAIAGRFFITLRNRGMAGLEGKKEGPAIHTRKAALFNP